MSGRAQRHCRCRRSGRSRRSPCPIPRRTAQAAQGRERRSACAPAHNPAPRSEARAPDRSRRRPREHPGRVPRRRCRAAQRWRPARTVYLRLRRRWRSHSEHAHKRTIGKSNQLSRSGAFGCDGRAVSAVRAGRNGGCADAACFGAPPARSGQPPSPGANCSQSAQAAEATLVALVALRSGQIPAILRRAIRRDIAVDEARRKAIESAPTAEAARQAFSKQEDFGRVVNLSDIENGERRR